MRTRARTVVFHEVKHGNHGWEWEDGAAYRADGDTLRCAVADGATEAFDPIRWVDLIVETFIGKRPGGPADMTPDAFRAWFEFLQRAWAEEELPPAAAGDVFARLKAADGSFATLVCCQVDGLGGPAPVLTAAALGDTVLFHVRGGALDAHFPALEPADFGRTPEGLFTAPSELDRMERELGVVERVPLAVGDRVYIATDAFAAWLLQVGPSVWGPLAAIDHPDVFRRLVADRRAAGDLVNDDVTLLRIEITDADPDFVKVAR